MAIARYVIENTISAHYLRQFYDFLDADGYNMPVILAGTTLTPDSLLQENEQLPISNLLTLLRNALQLRHDPSLGVRFGLQLSIAQHGFLGYGIRASKTLEDALKLAVRFSHTRTSLLVLNFFIKDDMAILQVDTRMILGDLLPLLMDSLISSFFVIGEQVMAARGGVTVHLSYPEQPHHQQLTKFGHTLCFNSAHNQFIFPAIALQLALGAFDPLMVEMVTTQCMIEGQKVRIDNNLVVDVKRLAEVYLCAAHSFECTAQALRLTPRTLRRHLAAAGTTYNAILDEIKQKLAIDRLLYSQQSIESISSELGYQDPSNFGRAFRRWTGQSPKVFRQMQMQQRV